MDCKHIIGFDEGYGNTDEPEEYERPQLIYIGDPFTPTPSTKFIFCPLCGEIIVIKPKG